jgi:hypothetical protein
MCVKLASEFELTPMRRKAISAILEGIIIALTKIGYLEQDKANELIEKLDSDALNVGQLRLLTDIVVGWFSVCGYFNEDETSHLQELLNHLWGYYDMPLSKSRKKKRRTC